MEKDLLEIWKERIENEGKHGDKKKPIKDLKYLRLPMTMP